MDVQLAVVCSACKKATFSPIPSDECEWDMYCSSECLEKDSEKHAKKCRAAKLLNGHVEKTHKRYTIEHNALNNNRFSCVALHDMIPGECVLDEQPIACILSYDAIDRVTKDLKNFFPVDSPLLVHINPPDINDPEKIGDFIDLKMTDAMCMLYPWIGKCKFFTSKLIGQKNVIDAIKDIHEKRKDSMSLAEVSEMYGIVALGCFNIKKELSSSFMAKGFFPRASLFNHSCVPNLDFVFSEGRLMFFTTKGVKRGEELTIDFMEGMLDFYPGEDRKQVLLQHCNIECMCKLCNGDIKEEHPSDDSNAQILNLRDHRFLYDMWVKDKTAFEKRPKMLISLAKWVVKVSIDRLKNPAMFSQIRSDHMEKFASILKYADTRFSRLEYHNRVKSTMAIGSFVVLTNRVLVEMELSKGENRNKIDERSIVEYFKRMRREDRDYLVELCKKIKSNPIFYRKLLNVQRESDGITINVEELFSILYKNIDNISLDQ